MPFHLLSMFAHATLPIEVKDTEDINAVLALSAAGLIAAEVPQVVLERQGPCYNGVAIVTAVTSEGHAVIKKRSQHPGQNQSS